jgi:hypothetical protein
MEQLEQENASLRRSVTKLKDAAEDEARITRAKVERQEAALRQAYKDALTLEVEMPWTNQQLVSEPFEALKSLRETTREALALVDNEQEGML